MNKLLHIDFEGKRVYGLDLLRAIAIIIVVLSHGGILLPNKISALQDRLLIDGVYLFFILSGYLIGTILIKTFNAKKINLKTLFDFWIRRWFRTLPAYLLVLIILIVAGLIFNHGLGGVNPLPYFFFLQNFHSPHPPLFAVAWTLSVEEWFYIIMPVLVFVLMRCFKFTIKKAILSVAIAIIVGSIALRWHHYLMNPVSSISQWDSLFRKEVIYRLDSLMFGVIGAYIAYFYKGAWIKYKKRVFATGLFILIFSHILSNYIAYSVQPVSTGWWFYLSIFSFTVTALGIVFLLPLLSQLKTGSGKIFNAVTTISISSYSIYLIHLVIIQPIVVYIFGTDVSRFEMILRYCLYWILSIGCSILLYKYYEKPTTKLREKIVSKREAVTPLEPGI